VIARSRPLPHLDLSDVHPVLDLHSYLCYPHVLRIVHESGSGSRISEMGVAALAECRSLVSMHTKREPSFHPITASRSSKLERAVIGSHCHPRKGSPSQYIISRQNFLSRRTEALPDPVAIMVPLILEVRGPSRTLASASYLCHAHFRCVPVSADGDNHCHNGNNIYFGRPGR
jgi:hypothetical protein